MTIITRLDGSTYQTTDKMLAQWHVWSRVWPSYNRRYEGVVWASDPADAGHTARKQFGNGKVYDIQTGRYGGIVRKGA